jgi:hypothetical protein
MGVVGHPHFGRGSHPFDRSGVAEPPHEVTYGVSIANIETEEVSIEKGLSTGHV